ncbi:MAG TPA: trimeric intracellular cation channel family protein [Polyangia bacterium]
MEHPLFVVVDLLGTIAFAISGATAATERRLDLFGVYAVAFVTACGGGIVRDLCLGATPPVAISDWRYLVCAAVASTLAIWAGPWVDRLKNPVAIFDSLGLGFFAVVGAHKAFVLSGHAETAVVLGTVSAVGGGVMRDVLLTRLPVVLAKEIYALAALVAAILQVTADVTGWSRNLAPWFAIGVCLAIRLLAIRYAWGLPAVGRR